jgi:hypothetical protein
MGSILSEKGIDGKRHFIENQCSELGLWQANHENN